MRLEWLEDILAVLDSGSFIRAAEKRCITQSAFSRRLKLIENYIGIELFDRSKKPAQLKRSVIAQQHNLLEIVTSLHNLINELRNQNDEVHDYIVIAGQHAISTLMAATLIKKINVNKNISVSLLSANREECYAFLISKHADIILIHQTVNEQLPIHDGMWEQCNLGQDKLIPVCLATKKDRIMDSYVNSIVPIITYPADSFLGQVMKQNIFPHMLGKVSTRKKAETALTNDVLQLVLNGIGLAWLPHSFVMSELANGSLKELSDIFPSYELSKVAIRLNNNKSSISDYAWQVITSLNYLD